MRTRLMATLALAAALMGCGTSGQPGATGQAASPTGGGATVPAGGGSASFCDAAFRLQMADSSTRAEIQAGLESDTPAGQEENVAVVRKFMERQASGDDPYKDPDFLLEYDNAVHDLWEHCERG